MINLLPMKIGGFALIKTKLDKLDFSPGKGHINASRNRRSLWFPRDKESAREKERDTRFLFELRSLAERAEMDWDMGFSLNSPEFLLRGDAEIEEFRSEKTVKGTKVRARREAQMQASPSVEKEA